MRVKGDLSPSEKDAGMSLSCTAARKRCFQRGTNPLEIRNQPTERDTRPSRGVQTPEQGESRGQGGREA